jgi:hypothetical protein
MTSATPAAVDADTQQVRALTAIEALIVEHDVADAGTECRACDGQMYPCEIRLHLEDAAHRLRNRMSYPRRPAAGTEKISEEQHDREQQRGRLEAQQQV